MIYINLSTTYIIQKIKKNDVIYCYPSNVKDYSDTVDIRSLGEVVVDEKNIFSNIQKQIYNWASTGRIHNKNVFEFGSIKYINSIIWLITSWDLIKKLKNQKLLECKIQKIIRLHCDNKIKIIYSESEVYLLNSLRDSKNVEFILKGKSYKKYINHLEFLFILLLPLYFFVPIFIFVRKFLFKIFKKSSLERKKIDFVFFSNTSSFVDGSIKSYDKLFYTFLKESKKSSLAHCYVDIFSPSSLKIKEMYQKILMTNRYMPMEAYFSFKSIFCYGFMFLKILYKFKKISTSFHNEITQNIKNHDIEFEFLKIKWIYSSFISLYYFIYKDFLTNVAPQKIFMTGEAGFYGNLLGSIANNMGINYYGIQHGAMDETLAWSYIHIKNHLNPYDYRNLDCNPNYCVFPKTTFVWSKKNIDKWVNAFKYPKKSVEIVGNPFFELYSNNILNDKLSFLNQYSIPRNKIIILLALKTGGKASTPKFDESILNIAYSLSLTKDVFVLCKLHPYESDKIHRKIIRNLGLSRDQAFVSRNIEMVHAIINSDFVISAGSTVIWESLLAKKPTIVINLGDHHPIARKLKNSKAVFMSDNSKEILNYIRKIHVSGISIEKKNHMKNEVDNEWGYEEKDHTSYVRSLLIR